MKTSFFVVLVLICLKAVGQSPIAQLNNFANPALFNVTDSACVNLSGEWTGEETEFIDDKGNQKGKYAIKFILNQQGNRVWGNSLISFDNGQSMGNMKIRGLVAGNKLYFEEYELVEQRFSQPGVLWCLRTGELDLKFSGRTAQIEGANYKGYASYYYFECAGKVAMSLSKELTEAEAKKIDSNEALKGKHEMQLHPNPAAHEVTVTFIVTKNERVRIDMFTLSGELVGNIVDEPCQAGTHQKLFNLANYAAGVYLIRMQTGNEVIAKHLVIAR